MKPPRFRLELRPEPNCSDPILAIRALLKRALREYRLRCTSIEEIKADAQSDAR